MNNNNNNKLKSENFIKMFLLINVSGINEILNVYNNDVYDINC